MFNAQTKFSILIFAAASVLSGCAGSASSDSRAKALYAEATTAMESADYERALSLIDSIDSSCPDAIDVRKECRLLKPQVIEKLAASTLSRIDSLQVVNAYRGDSLRQLVVLQNNAVEGYYVGKQTVGDNERTKAGIHSRVSPDFHYYISIASPQKIGTTSVILNSNGESVQSAVVSYDGERNNRDGKFETITFTEAESAPLAAFISEHEGQPINITFKGEKGECQTPLDDSQRASLTACYGLVMAANNDKTYRMQKEQWSKKLDIARKQLTRVAK